MSDSTLEWVGLNHNGNGNRNANGKSLVSVLHRIQDQYGFLPEESLRDLSNQTGVPMIEIYRVATFYRSFSLVPKGKHQVQTCCGTACHVRGSEKVTKELSSVLGVQPDSTSDDGNFTLETVNCLGACALAPLVVIDGKYYGNMTPAKIRRVSKEITGTGSRNATG